MEDHVHGPDGHVVISEPSPAAEEAEAVEEVAHAEVEIARIEADRDVAVAKIAAKTEEAHDETEVEALRAEIRGMREILNQLMPPPPPEPEPMPEPEPIVIAQQDNGPDVAPPPEKEEHREPKKQKPKGLGLW
jgi:hypothetical protein